MMKKFLTTMLALALTLSVSACSGQTATSAPASSAPAAGGASSEALEAPTVTFPKIVNVMVPFNAGSNTDSQLRFIQPYLEKHLGATLVVNNAGGASGVIGTTEFVSQKADGSNILFSLPTPTVYKPAGGETTYTVDDLIPVSRVTASPFYLALSGEKNDFADGAAVLEFIKANPGKFTYANAGNGGIAHLAVAAFLAGEGLDALSVPFTGGTADCYTAVMGGHVMAYSVSEPELVGRTDVRAVINLGEKSVTEGFQNIPTLAELGYEGYSTDTFAGFYYMKGVDPAMVAAFDAAVAATLSDEEFLAAAAKANFVHNYADAAAFSQQVKDTTEMLTPVLQSLK